MTVPQNHPFTGASLINHPLWGTYGNPSKIINIIYIYIYICIAIE